jgi:general secretion pathway protein K
LACLKQKGDAMKHDDPRRGVVLMTVLWSIALLSALAMAAAVTFRGFAGVMAVERDRLQGDALLSAGLETAAGIASNSGDAPLINVETTVNLATGLARLRLNDEGGRIDIGRAPAIVLAGLLRSVGAKEAAANDVAQRIVDRRGASNKTRTVASPDSPNAAGMPRADQQPFSDVRQLQLVPGMSPDWVAALAPLATVFGGQTVNPLTAPPGVVAALPGMSKDQVDAFLTTRRSFPADADRLMRMVGAAQQYLAVKPQRVASVELTAELPDGYVAAARAVIVVLPQDSEPYRVLVWTPVSSPYLL